MYLTRKPKVRPYHGQKRDDVVFLISDHIGRKLLDAVSPDPDGAGGHLLLAATPKPRHPAAPEMFQQNIFQCTYLFGTLTFSHLKNKKSSSDP